MNWTYRAAASLVATTLWLQPTAEQRIDAAIDSVKSQVPGLALVSAVVKFFSRGEVVGVTDIQRVVSAANDVGERHSTTST